MALSAPIDRGAQALDYSASNLISNTFTPSVDSLMLAMITIKGANSVTSITGHDGGTAWVNIATVSYGGSLRVEVWGAHSGTSPTSGTISAAVAGTSRKQANFAEITGADVSGTVANSFIQTDNGAGYASSILRSLAGATSLTIGFWGEIDYGSIGTPEGTTVNALSHPSTNQHSTIDYNLTGDTTPSYTLTGSNGYASFAAEVKAGITGTGWNNEVRDKEVVTSVVRTNDNQVTITLSAAAAYDITVQDVITATIPASALLTSTSPIVATPTFTVDIDTVGAGAALTTVSTSTNSGSLTNSSSLPTSGEALTSSTNSPSVSNSNNLTGQESTLSTGSMTASASGGATLTGNNVINSIGDLSLKHSLNLLGEGSVLNIGSVSAGASGGASLSGNNITSTTGLLTNSKSLGVSGSSSSLNVGDLVSSRNLSLLGEGLTLNTGSVSTSTPAGVSITGVLSSVGVSGLDLSISHTLTGEQLANSIGNVLNTLTTNQTGESLQSAVETLANKTANSLSGQSSNYALGTLSPQIDASAILTGVQTNQSTGSLLTQRTVTIVGQNSIITLGDFTNSILFGISSNSTNSNVGSLDKTINTPINTNLSNISINDISTTGGKIVFWIDETPTPATWADNNINNTTWAESAKITATWADESQASDTWTDKTVTSAIWVDK